MKIIVLFFVLFEWNILYGLELSKITIEASKLDDNHLRESSSVDSINQQKLDLYNTQSIEDLSSVVPNANISGIGNRSDKTFTVRGISNYTTLESSVVLYVDDVPIPFSYGYGAIDFNNIESIEFLKGPQGTLFGKNAQSGVINISTKEPTKEPSATVKLGYGSYDSKNFYGYASSVINEDTAISVAITKNTTDGYSQNVITGNDFDTRDLINFATKLHYKPTSNLSLALNYTKTKTDDGGSPFKMDTKANPYEIDNERLDEFNRMDNDLLSFVLKYMANDYKFTSSTSYARQKLSKFDYVDLYGGLGLQVDVNVEELTQELRLNYSGQDFDMLLGAFYSEKINFDYKENQTLYIESEHSVNQLSNADENMAVFAQLRYYINDQYSLMGGLRYQVTKRSFDREMNKFFAPTTDAEDSTQWNYLLPTLSFAYDGYDDLQTYLTYSKGYRAGGYNYRSDDVLKPFKPETVDSFELGHKKISKKGLSYTTAIFYNFIHDLKLNQYNDDFSSNIQNTEEAHSYGVELSAEYMDNYWLINASFGYTEAEVDSSEQLPAIENNKMIDVPNITAALSVKYKINHMYYVNPSVRYIGERYYSVDNTAKENGYAVTSLSMGYEKNDLHIKLYANNLFNKEYVDFMFYTPSHNYYHFGAPRVVGIELSKSF